MREEPSAAGRTQDEFALYLIQNQSRVYAYIATLLPNRSDAEEILQRTSLVMWQKWEQFDPKYGFVPWARGITLNEIRNFFGEANERTCNCRILWLQYWLVTLSPSQTRNAWKRTDWLPWAIAWANWRVDKNRYWSNATWNRWGRRKLLDRLAFRRTRFICDCIEFVKRCCCASNESLAETSAQWEVRRNELKRK